MDVYEKTCRLEIRWPNHHLRNRLKAELPTTWLVAVSTVPDMLALPSISIECAHMSRRLDFDNHR